MKTFKCKKCGTEFPDAAHLSRHEGVHKHAKGRIVEFGDVETNRYRLMG